MLLLFWDFLRMFNLASFGQRSMMIFLLDLKPWLPEMFLLLICLTFQSLPPVRFGHLLVHLRHLLLLLRKPLRFLNSFKLFSQLRAKPLSLFRPKAGYLWILMWFLLSCLLLLAVCLLFRRNRYKPHRNFCILRSMVLICFLLCSLLSRPSSVLLQSLHALLTLFLLLWLIGSRWLLLIAPNPLSLSPKVRLNLKTFDFYPFKIWPIYS